MRTVTLIEKGWILLACGFVGGFVCREYIDAQRDEALRKQVMDEEIRRLVREQIATNANDNGTDDFNVDDNDLGITVHDVEQSANKRLEQLGK
jgi:hypothetical protein